MFTQSYQKQEWVPGDDFTRLFVHLLRSASEINRERCKSFCNVFHEDGAGECLLSRRTDGTVNVMMSCDRRLTCL